eukprot:m.52691 g.52691  ORF g.52691 m.52691 type:complete len:356 (+) comp10811_c0_seq1:60-1127(+)
MSAKQEFVELFQPLLDEVIADCEKCYPDYNKDAIVWFRKVMEYNCLGGKMNRGLSVLATYKRLIFPREPTDEEIREANILGWCIEWLQAFFLVSDDIMDASATRRGQPCWYKAMDPPYKGWKGHEVGMVAINDAFLIESAIYKILKRNFRSKPYYVDLLELMHETSYQTELGQMLDLITAPEHHVDINKFTLEKYKCIVKYKTAFYSFYLPVAMGMLMNGISDKQKHDNALEILLEMGELFQIQDDYLDCFGDPEKIGKIGTDIQDNKCGWLIVQAMKLATPEQKLILEENYAKKDEAKVEKVKAVYRDLDLPSVYHAYERQSYDRLQKLMEEKAGDLPVEIFKDFADKIYFRTK